MHNSVTPVYTQQKQILLPQTVLAEVAYLVGRNASSATLVAFLNRCYDNEEKKNSI
jgi:hypothetical protein